MPKNTAVPNSAQERRSEETVLFNGKDLKRWYWRNGGQIEPLTPELFIDRGELHCPPNAVGSLRTVEAYMDFVLRLEFRIPVGAVDNRSGIWLCSPEDSAPLQIDGTESQGVIVYTVQPGETGDLLAAARGGGDEIPPARSDRRRETDRPLEQNRDPVRRPERDFSIER